MSDPIDTICSLAGCPREDAERMYAETKDVVEAVDKLLAKVSSPAEKYMYSRRSKVEETEEQKTLRKLRDVMEQITENIGKSISSNQRGSEGSVVTPSHHEETVQQSNCSQECHLPSLELEAQIPEIACLLPSESTYDSPLNDRT